MKIASTLIATAALIALPTAAFAKTNTAENISTCKAEIATKMAATATDTDLDFKSVKGNSRKQTLKFRIKADGESDKVTCKVSRDNSVEVVWGKTVKPVISKAVQAEEATTAGE